MKEWIVRLAVIGIIAFLAWQGYKAFTKGSKATVGMRNTQAEEMVDNQ